MGFKCNKGKNEISGMVDLLQLGGNLFTGSGPQSNMSIGRTTRSLMKEEPDGYTHVYFSSLIIHAIFLRQQEKMIQV